jgi:putative membrane protein
MFDSTLGAEIISTLIFGGIGIFMAVIAFLVVDLLTPGRLKDDIVKDGNIALSLLASSFILGVCIIIASSIFG